MNFVEPIRRKEELEQMKTKLRKTGERNYLLFVFGINVGLRISDILNLKVKDVISPYGTMNTHIELKEKKTKKTKRFKINPILAEELKQYVSYMDYNDYLFKSRNGENQPLTRVQAYRILNNVAKKLNLEKIGTHTLRKTFGYHFYQQTHDIATLQKLFNHSSMSVTLRYIRNYPGKSR